MSLLQKMTPSQTIWNIQPEGRNWASEAELLTRDEMIPVGARIEIHNGKLLFNDEDRLTLFAMLLENIGLDNAVASIEALSDAYYQKPVSKDETSRDSSVDAKAHNHEKATPITALREPPRQNADEEIDDINSAELTLSLGQSIKTITEDFINNPIRYVIYSSLADIKLYLNIESDTCSIELDSATFFKDLSAAKAVANVYDDSSLRVAQISINEDERTILADNCLSSSNNK